VPSLIRFDLSGRISLLCNRTRQKPSSLIDGLMR